MTFVLFSELWPQRWDCKSSERDVHSTKGPKGGLRGGGQQEVGGTKAALYTRGGKCQRLNVKVKKASEISYKMLKSENLLNAKKINMKSQHVRNSVS